MSTRLGPYHKAKLGWTSLIRGVSSTVVLGLVASTSGFSQETIEDLSLLGLRVTNVKVQDSLEIEIANQQRMTVPGPLVIVEMTGTLPVREGQIKISAYADTDTTAGLWAGYAADGKDKVSKTRVKGTRPRLHVLNVLEGGTMFHTPVAFKVQSWPWKAFQASHELGTGKEVVTIIAAYVLPPRVTSFEIFFSADPAGKKVEGTIEVPGTT